MPSAFPRCNCGSEKSCLELSKGKTHQEGYASNPQNHHPKKPILLPIKRNTPGTKWKIISNPLHPQPLNAGPTPPTVGWGVFPPSIVHQIKTSIQQNSYLGVSSGNWRVDDGGSYIPFFEAGNFSLGETWDSSNEHGNLRVQTMILRGEKMG